MHEPVPPGLLDQFPLDESTDREMGMQSVPGLVPLRYPHIRERLAAELGAEGTKEFAQMFPNDFGIMASVAAIGERSESVQPIGSAIAA